MQINCVKVISISLAQSNINQYIISGTKSRQKYYEALKEKDEKDQQMIAQQLLRMTNLFEEIRKFRSKMTTYNATAKTEISEILNEHDFFQKAYWTVKNRFLSGAHRHLLLIICSHCQKIRSTIYILSIL